MPQSWAGDTKNPTGLGVLATFAGLPLILIAPGAVGKALTNDDGPTAIAWLVFSVASCLRWWVWLWGWQAGYFKEAPADLAGVKKTVHIASILLTRGGWSPYAVDHEPAPPPSPEVNRRAARVFNLLMALAGITALALTVAASRGR